MTGVLEDGRPVVEWGAAGVSLERESGDACAVAAFPHGAVVAAIDGLGHGAEAAAAANEAARILEAFAGEPVVALLQRCHEALHGTRGAVMSLASFDARDGAMTWSGVGNVEGILLRADPVATPARESMSSRGGILGYQLPALRPVVLPVRPGDTLVLATDGLRSEFIEGLGVPGTPQEIADSLLARYARGNDDALVVVARYLGPAGGAAPARPDREERA